MLVKKIVAICLVISVQSLFTADSKYGTSEQQVVGSDRNCDGDRQKVYVVHKNNFTRTVLHRKETVSNGRATLTRVELKYMLAYGMFNRAIVLKNQQVLDHLPFWVGVDAYPKLSAYAEQGFERHAQMRDLDAIILDRVIAELDDFKKFMHDRIRDKRKHQLFVNPFIQESEKEIVQAFGKK